MSTCEHCGYVNVNCPECGLVTCREYCPRYARPAIGLPTIRQVIVKKLDEQHIRSGQVPETMVSLSLWLSHTLTAEELEQVREFQIEKGEVATHVWMTETLGESEHYINTDEGDVMSVAAYKRFAAEAEAKEAEEAREAQDNPQDLH